MRVSKRSIRKECLCVFLVDVLIESAMVWKGGRVLAILPFFLVNSRREESRTGKCLFREYRTVC